ncbi:MAG: L-seryl-tRNA(Sec) selenium transferase [Dehalococcoidia bacterium]|nr:L-seryl-tRNA(Sec) selenium transferase [Dehalococcoidia bacterium]
MQFRHLPSVDKVMGIDTVLAMATAYNREWVVNLVRQQLDEARRRIRHGGEAPTPAELAEAVCHEIQSVAQAEPRHVINATGVIIHTNLGRAPLSQAAVDSMVRAARGYSNLELDLESGRRGSRQAHLQSLLRQLTGAEAALAVNNNASAVLLGLTALAAGKEVIVSRGESVEIGGGFRIPDVLRQSGGALVDVGTTNRTYAKDYENAITDNTAALLKVHSSNFRVEGFTETVDPEELVELGQRYGVPVLHDVGSGCLLPTERYSLAHEPTPQESIAAGVGLVLFSGDKLLGGPQSGMVVGNRDLVERLARHPLARAIRIDKFSLAALTATLLHYLKGEAVTDIPIWRMIATSEEAVRERAQLWQKQLERSAGVEPARSAIGGGSLPGETLPSWVLRLSCEDVPGGPEEVMGRLRRADLPVVARIEENQVLLDPRSVLPEEDGPLLRAVRGALAQ